MINFKAYQSSKILKSEYGIEIFEHPNELNSFFVFFDDTDATTYLHRQDLIYITDATNGVPIVTDALADYVINSKFEQVYPLPSTLEPIWLKSILGGQALGWLDPQANEVSVFRVCHLKEEYS